MDRPTVRQLEYVVALAAELHFGRAAARCHVSQPALSTQVARLEEELGVALFERDRRRVLATAAGSELARRARAALTAIDALVEAAAVHAAPFTGLLRVAAIPTLAPFVLPRALPGIRTAHPELRLRLAEEPTASIVDGVEEGRLDLGVVALESDLGPLERLPIARDPFLLAVPADHPLAGRRTVREADLDRGEVLLLDDGH